jgi:hypothetical protein
MTLSDISKNKRETIEAGGVMYKLELPDDDYFSVRGELADLFDDIPREAMGIRNLNFHEENDPLHSFRYDGVLVAKSSSL